MNLSVVLRRKFGENFYFLVDEEDTSEHHCESNCVYEKDSESLQGIAWRLRENPSTAPMNMVRTKYKSCSFYQFVLYSTSPDNNHNCTVNKNSGKIPSIHREHRCSRQTKGNILWESSRQVMGCIWSRKKGRVENK